MKNNKGFANILLVALVVILGGALGYITLVKKAPVTFEEQNPDAPMDALPKAPTSNSKTNPVTDPTAGWKTYANAEYGFEFKYPSNWVVGRNAFSQITFTSPNTKAVADQRTKDCNDKNDLTVCVPENIEVDVVVTPRLLASPPVHYGVIKKVVFNGVLFTEYEEAGLYSEKHYEVTHGGVTYDFTAYNKPILDQILSTFKFTTPSAVIYRNDQYGFEIPLSASWREYSIQMKAWKASDIAGSYRSQSFALATGPEIHITNPFLISQGSREDIPVMIFTRNQWNEMKANFERDVDLDAVGGAGAPDKLGENDLYVFAFPSRLNVFCLSTCDEIEKIFKNFKALPSLIQ